MTQINIENPTVEQFLANFAHEHGVDISGAVELLAAERIQRTVPVEPQPVDPATDPVILLMKQLMAEIPTDPEELRKADEEYEEFVQNLNQNRIDAGEDPLF